MRRNELVYSLNAGGVDPEALARVDLEKMRVAGEHPVANFLPRVVGPLTLRPGSENLLRITSDAQSRMIRFLRTIGTGYQLLLSASAMRVVLNGAIVQVPSVATTINPASWSNVSTSPATASGGPPLSFSATANAVAALRQAVTIAGGDQAKSNILTIAVSRGPVTLRIGVTAGGQEIISDTTLFTGTHKIGFVPNTGTVYVELRSSTANSNRYVSSVQFESNVLGGTGDLVLPTPWSTWAQIQALRAWQSIDVMFIGDGAGRQQRIEHRGDTAWSVCNFMPVRGPFGLGASTVSLTPSAQTGDVTITSTEKTFLSGHVGTLIELTSTGKTATATLAGVNQSSDYITVTGVAAARTLVYQGTDSSFVGTLVLERSFDPTTPPSTWTTYQTYVNGAATVGPTSYQDTNDNVTAYYRWRVSAYTSGSVAVSLTFQNGIQIGSGLIVGYTSPTQVTVATDVAFGNTNATNNWRLGAWSDVNGWPRVPLIQDDRFYWFRKDVAYGSTVDDYTNYDDNQEGDSAPLTRSVGSGSQEGVVWAKTQTRLLVGTSMFEAVIQSSQFDTPITPTAFTVRKPSRRGSLDLDAAEHDDGLFFVQRSGLRIYEFSAAEAETMHHATDLTRLIPSACVGGVVDTAVQQQPDTRLYVVMADGSCLVLTYDRDDKVVAFTTIAITGGFIECVSVMPNTAQDDVFFVVKRNSSQRYIERLAPEFNQRSVSTCALLDGFKTLTGPVSSISGATHLAGQTVQVWADGARRGDVTLDGSGNGTLDGTYTRVVYGTHYMATFKSTKLAYGAQLGSAIGQDKIVHGAALLLSNSVLDGITIGGETTSMDPMPAYVRGAVRTPGQFFAQYDQDVFPLQSEWDADSRIYITVDSAYGPCTVQALVLDVETRDGVPSQKGD